MPDAPGLELIRGEIERDHPHAVLDTSFANDRATLIVDPAQVLAVLSWLRDEPAHRYTFLSSLHVADYLPAESRFGVHYELLNRERVERVRVKAMLQDPAGADKPGSKEDPASRPDAQSAPGADPQPPSAGGVVAGVPRGAEGAQRPSTVGEAATTGPAAGALPQIDSCVGLFPTANFQEREAFDFFGILFRGHPNLTRILMPDDYVGWPQRRDFPVGGEPVTFTYNEHDRG